MIRVLKWVALGIGGILLLGMLAVLALPSIVNLERYRGALASRAGKALGREVTLGDLRVSLWGGIGAKVKGIQIGQAAGFGSEPFLAADALRVHVQLLPLLRGQVKVSTAILERPRIRLTHTRDGRWSVDDLLKAHPAPSTPKPSAEVIRPGKAPLLGGLLLSEVAVKDGEVTLLDESRSSGIMLTLTDLDLSLRQPTVSDPVEVRSRAKIGSPGAGRLETSARVSSSDADSPILDATVALDEVEVAPWQALFLRDSGTKLSGPLSGEVKVSGPITRAAFAGNLNLKPIAIQAGEGFRKAAGEDGSLSFEGRREDQGVILPKVTVILKELKVDASLRIPDLQVPRITFMAASGKVDLDRLLAKPKAGGGWLDLGPGVAEAAPSRPGPESRAAGPGLTAQGRISIGDMRYRGLTWTGVQADVRYQDALVYLQDFRATAVGGKVTAKGEVDLRPKTPRVSLTSRLDSLATEPLVQALGLGPWSLRSGLSLDSTVSFVGLSVPEILGSAAGGGSLLLTDGRFSGYKPLERLSEVLAPILATQGLRTRLNEFDRLSGHYSLDKGVLRTKDLTLTKTEGTVTAVGSLGLLDSSLNFDVVARLGRTTVEAKVTGTTSQPIVVPKLGRLQQRFETEVDKALPGDAGKGLKDIFKGLFGR